LRSLSAAPRLAIPEEQDEVVDLLRQRHAEEGFQSFVESKVREFIQPMIYRQWGVVIVIAGNRGVEATMGLLLSEMFWTTDPHLERLFDFVRNDCRRSHHARDLINFAKRYADELGVPLLCEQLITPATAAKERLDERQLPKAGSLFIHRPVPRVTLPVAAEPATV
jgi:hypothetical protein